MTDRNQSDADRLDGGTQGHGAVPQAHVGGRPGGTNALDGTGGNLPAATGSQQRGTANQAKQDAETAFEDGTRKPSGTEAKQWARDDADADTTAGTPYGGVAPDRQVHKMQRDKD
ncbi:MAG: hypothetical protein K2X87_27555 [Gemmataceae bacterium]|nr:hypothetical protein [Gemmataceae bacterium]